MMMMSGGDLCTVRFRFDGNGEQVSTLIDKMRSLDDVDRVVEVGAEMVHMREDSSSAGSDDFAGSDFHDVEIHALYPGAAERVRNLVEIAARDLGVVVEYIDRF
ncbi:MAG: hypothetical protein ACREPU_04335 [Rhodanobacteraceae bacterium]